MLLNNLVKVGSGVVKVSIATVKVATPLVGQATSSTVSFTRREVALAKQEAAVQAKLIKRDYNAMNEVMASSKKSIMNAFNTDLGIGTKTVVATA